MLRLAYGVHFLEDTCLSVILIGAPRFCGENKRLNSGSSILMPVISCNTLLVSVNLHGQDFRPYVLFSSELLIGKGSKNTYLF